MSIWAVAYVAWIIWTILLLALACGPHVKTDIGSDVLQLQLGLAPLVGIGLFLWWLL